METHRVLGAALLVAASMSDGGQGADQARAVCPPGATTDPARASAIRDALTGVPEGRLALAGRDVPVCFGPGPSAIVTGGPLVLDVRRPDGTLAARAAHLLAHDADRALFDAMPRDGAGCDAWVDRVVAAERQARGVELRVAAALGAAPEEQADLVEAYAARCAGR